jgi:hypothetical protein
MFANSIYRRRWDSNPRKLALHLISNQTQSTNSATSPQITKNLNGQEGIRTPDTVVRSHVL